MLPSFSTNFGQTKRLVSDASFFQHAYFVWVFFFPPYLFNPNSPDAGNVYFTSHLVNVWLRVESRKQEASRKESKIQMSEFTFLASIFFKGVIQLAVLQVVKFYSARLCMYRQYFGMIYD